jgi:hypothetical protein
MEGILTTVFPVGCNRVVSLVSLNLVVSLLSLNPPRARPEACRAWRACCQPATRAACTGPEDRAHSSKIRWEMISPPAPHRPAAAASAGQTPPSLATELPRTRPLLVVSWKKLQKPKPAQLHLSISQRLSPYLSLSFSLSSCCTRSCSPAPCSRCFSSVTSTTTTGGPPPPASELSARAQHAVSAWCRWVLILLFSNLAGP